jgi:hypothetical protein
MTNYSMRWREVALAHTLGSRRANAQPLAATPKLDSSLDNTIPKSKISVRKPITLGVHRYVDPLTVSTILTDSKSLSDRIRLFPTTLVC